MHRWVFFIIVTVNLLQGVYHQTISSEERKNIFNLFGTAPTTMESTTLQASERIKDMDQDWNITESPTSPANKCECVSFYLCTNDSKIDTTGAHIIDIRGHDCGDYLEKCCDLSLIIKKPDIPESTESNALSECGKRNPNGVGFRITGDTKNEAQFGEFPWMVAVLHKTEVNGFNIEEYLCGGALIHPQAVLTSAHCVIDKKKKFLIRAGEWDTQTTKEIFPHQDRPVKSVTIHPDYYSGALLNDIALVLLESPFKLGRHIDVLCLPPQDITIPNGTRCLASGWGTDVYGQEGKYQVILKKIELPIVDGVECEANLRTTRLGPTFNLDKSFVCAGGELGFDTCDGDGGSPLVCLIPGAVERYQLVGLVSWGVGCGNDHIPGLYANVPLFRLWIDGQMLIHSLDWKIYAY